MIITVQNVLLCNRYVMNLINVLLSVQTINVAYVWGKKMFFEMSNDKCWKCMKNLFLQMSNIPISNPPFIWCQVTRSQQQASRKTIKCLEFRYLMKIGKIENTFTISPL